MPMHMHILLSSSSCAHHHIFLQVPPIQLVAAAAGVPSSSSIHNPNLTLPPPPLLSLTSSSNYSSSSSSFQQQKPRCSSRLLKLVPKLRCSNSDGENNKDDDDGSNSDSEDSDGGGYSVEIEKIGKNSRRIVCKIGIDAPLQTVWNILTDYERLPDFIPSLSLSQLLLKSPNFARLYQIGQQNLAFGLKFNAKGIVDCYEKDLESLPFGQRRAIEFKMIEGDFQLFEGKWSIEQFETGRNEDDVSLMNSKQFITTLSYVVDVEPKLWLPVHLVEGRLSKEIQKNLSCIREEAQKATPCNLPANL